MTKKRTHLNVESLENRVVLSHALGLPPHVAAPVSAGRLDVAALVSRHDQAGTVPSHIILPPPTKLPPGLVASWAIEAKAQQLGQQFTGPAVSGLETVPGGYRIQFANCDIYDSPSTGAHEVHGVIRAEYNATASETDASGHDVQNLLGLPTSDETNVPGVAGARMNTFQGGAIYWSPATGAHVVYGAIGAKYNSLGGAAVYGLPTTDEATVSDASWVRVTDFQNGGAIYWSAATGAHAVYGAIGAEYAVTAHEVDYYGNAVVRTLLGAPTSDEIIVPGVTGARMNTFQGGTIYWSPSTGAHAVYGVFGDLYNSMGGPTGRLGLPTVKVLLTPDATGDYQDYQGGAIYWSAATGAHDLYGPILQKWEALGGVKFGYPTTNEQVTPDGIGLDSHFLVRASTFTPSGQTTPEGAIDWTPEYGAHAVDGAIAALFAEKGWEQNGEAISDEVDLTSTGGAYQYFRKAIIVGFRPYAIDYTAATGAYVANTGSYADVAQGNANTCWILASIAAVEANGLDLSQIIQYQGKDTYKVLLYTPNDPADRPAGGYNPIAVSVYFDGSTNAADPGYSSTQPSQSWVVVMQRAVIEAIATWDSSQTITNPHSGGAGDALAALIGSGPTSVAANDANVQKEIETALSDGHNVVLTTLPASTTTLAAFHCYAVLSANSNGVVLYNPWGAAETSPTPDPQLVTWSVIAKDGSSFSVD
jgi:hypothetical protein